jgi:signal transduction histidine kinase
MVIDDQDALGHVEHRLCRYLRSMPHDRRQVETFLWGELLLVTLLGGELALFLATSSLRTAYAFPELKLVLATIFALGAGLVALLTATRFTVDGRRFDLLLSVGFFTKGAAWFSFTVAPAAVQVGTKGVFLWASIVGGLLGSALIATAPIARGRVRRRRFVLANALAAAGLALVVIWLVCRSLGVQLPNLDPGLSAAVPAALTAANAVAALLALLAVVGFANRYAREGKDLDRFLAFGSTLTLAAGLHYIFTPLVRSADVSPGDFLSVVSYAVLLAGVWRAIRESEFGRAVAEERARVAREIHDGLAQYLFAVATHTTMLEAGADPAVTIPKLKAAALAAQQEARYAILALSSAAGRSPFDAALQRFIGVLTADGALEVDLDLDPLVHLGPDEQIEVFRIVQEGLANARRHAGAHRARVAITGRGGRRVVVVTDDGAGFEPQEVTVGEGLTNMRHRAATIGGALSLVSAPGAGTSVELVLRG